MNTTYTKRENGGYYAFTPEGAIVVERRYEFTHPTRDWVARFRGQVVIGATREDAVDTMLEAVRRAAGPSSTERREAALAEAQQEDASKRAQQEAVADMYGPTGDAPADDDARVLSPMDRERQVRRMAAEIRAHQPEQRWAALNLAAALYDAGFRATDPGYPA